MDPTEDEKREFLRSLHDHLESGLGISTSAPPKALLGEFPLPEKHIARVLELASMATTRKTNNALWRFIHHIMPETANYRCRLDTSSATRPTVQLKEYTPGARIRVGIDGVLEAHQIPADNYAELEQLANNDDESTPLTRYRLWSRIEQLLPSVAVNAHANQWKLFVGLHEIAVFRTDQKEEEENDDADQIN